MPASHAPLRLFTVAVLCGAIAPTLLSAQPIVRVPEDQPTIQAAIDLALSGVTVVVSCGTYFESDIELKSGVSIVSETGDPACVTIDAQFNGRVFHGVLLDEPMTIEGITIANGSSDVGGAAMHFSGSGVTIRRCVFADNICAAGGGAIWCNPASVVVEECTFIGNTSFTSGGTFLGHGGDSILQGCTFYDNFGGGIRLAYSATAIVTNTIIAFCPNGEAIRCGPGGTPLVTCSNFFGNADGDWVGCVADQQGILRNMSADPLFCDPANGDLTLDASSPCAPDNSPDGCGLIGAFPVGCGGTASLPGNLLAETTWGAVKATFR